MLILTRRINEEIVLHKNGFIFCNIKILSIQGNIVRFGIGAHDEIEIDRIEIYNKKIGK